ncbi:MAG: serine acetyltransferase [Ignavibacteriae bacterium]|nr:serine acetyltransferase [Ignavibacteriota bacterium]
MSAIKFYRIANYLFRKKIPILPNIFQYIIFYLYNSYIPFKAEIGLGSDFGYGAIGVVLHERCKIGNNVMIGTNVTIGGRSGKFDVPTIGNNVYIATGAKVLGAINVGNNVIIGANAVVIYDIPDNTVVAGVPARIIKQNNTQK